MFMNKKGQVDFIGNLLTLIPKPILFIFFIMLLGVITLLLSPVFNSFGVQCMSDGEVVKLHEGNFITNLRLINSLPDADEIGGSSLSVDNVCLKQIDGKERFVSNGCVDCDLINTSVDNWDYCIDDAYKTADVDLSWWKRTIDCPRTSFCNIPEGYYFESDTTDFVCIGACENQDLALVRDDKLRKLGARPLYLDKSGDDIGGVFQYGCTRSLRVEPTIKGIPLFRLEYWAIFILIMLMLWGIMHFRQK